MKKDLSFFSLAIFLGAVSFGYTADSEEKVVAMDKARHDKKPDYWVYYRGGAIYKREWDRNFDGKADLRIFEEHKRLVEKHYDDNFDGKYEKIVKKPEKGLSGKTKYYVD